MNMSTDGASLATSRASRNYLRRILEWCRDRCFVVIALASLAVSCSETDTHQLPSDWAQWRGPMGSGVSEELDLPLRWGAKKNIRWKAEIPGFANSSPIVSAGLVIVATAEQSGKMVDRSIIALDEESGAVMWKTVVASKAKETYLNRESAAVGTTPISDGNRVYAYLGHEVVALTLDGELAWRQEVDSTYTESLRYGAAASPVLSGDTLIVFRDKEFGGEDQYPSWIVGLNKKTGKEIWRAHPEGCCSYVTPLVAQRGGSNEVIVALARKVASFDPETGKRLWQYPQDMNQPVAGVSLEGDILCVASGAHNVRETVCRRLSGAGEDTQAEVLWRSNQGVPDTSSPVLYQGRLYVVNSKGIAACYEAETGKMYWRKRLSGGSYHPSIVAGDGKIYLTNRSGYTVVIKAGDRYRVRARNSLGEKGSLATPAIANGHIYIRTESFVYSIRRPQT